MTKWEVLLSIHNSHQYEEVRRQMEEMRAKKKLNAWARWMLANLK